MSDEKKYEMDQDDQKKIQFQYMDFYANFEIVDSDQVSSDLDDLEAFENLQEGRYDICCRYEHERYQARRNSRVAEIPTVYLVSCIRTQHLPERKNWRIDSQQETKEEQPNSQYDSEDTLGKFYRLIPDEDNGINSHNAVNHILKPINIRSDLNHNMKVSYAHNKQKYIHSCLNYERPWKTDYITISGGQSMWEKQNKEKRLMHDYKNSKQNKVKKKGKNENNVRNSEDDLRQRAKILKKLDEINSMQRRFEQIYEEYEQKSRKSLFNGLSRNSSNISPLNQKILTKEPPKLLTIKLSHYQYLNVEQNNQSPRFRTYQNAINSHKPTSKLKEKFEASLNKSLISQSLIQRKRHRVPYFHTINNQFNSHYTEKNKNKYGSADEINQCLDNHKQKL